MTVWLTNTLLGPYHKRVHEGNEPKLLPPEHAVGGERVWNVIE